MIFAFIGAFTLCLLATIAARRLALSAGLVDRPDRERHLHDLPIPRVGGIAMYSSVAIVFMTVFLMRRFDGAGGIEPFQKMTFVIAAGGVVFFLGLWDDLARVRARTKFVVEVLIACAVFGAGIRIDHIAMAGGQALMLPEWVSLGITVVWIVGITNAFNLIDGSDGIAAGAGLFASVTLAIVCLSSGQPLAAALALALAGATLGFLFFNFPPATIFLGDSGSLFLGFTLATLGIVSAMQAETGTMALALPAVACGLPILDTTLAIVRRFLRGEHIFTPDRGHIHHRLQDLGLSPRNVVLLLHALCAAFALLGLLLAYPPGAGAATALLLVLALTAVTIGRLEIPELLEVQRALRRGLQQRSVIAHNVRIREAIRRIQQTNHPHELVGSLVYAFAGGEFDRVELWLEERYASGIAGCTGLSRRGGGYVWTYSRNGNGVHDDLWAVQLPFRDESGVPSRAVGHLAMWRPCTGDHLLTDLKLIAMQLQPELQKALVRLAEGVTVTPGHANDHLVAAAARKSKLELQPNGHRSAQAIVMRPNGAR